MMWNELLIALSLVLIIEGIAPFIDPNGLREALLRLARLSNQQLRIIGLSCMILGLISLYLVH